MPGGPSRAVSPPSGRISPPAAAGGYGFGAYAPAPRAPMPAPMAPRFFPASGLNLGGAQARPPAGMTAFPRAAPGLGPARGAYPAHPGAGLLMQPFPAPRLLGQMGAAIMGAPSPSSPVMRGAGAAAAARGAPGWYAPVGPRSMPRALPPLGAARAQIAPPTSSLYPGSPGGFKPPPGY